MRPCTPPPVDPPDPLPNLVFPRQIACTWVMSGRPWLDNPNAPQIPYELYFAEKVHLAGSFLGGISYGVVIILFFQCMNALLNPINRPKGGIKWGLVAHTTAMFLLPTIGAGLDGNVGPKSLIDYREFPGSKELPPGPLGYQLSLYTKPAAVIPVGMFVLNNLLADGFLLYRSYIIYAMNRWAIAVPCVMYLTSLSLGIVFVFEISQPGSPFARPTAIYDFSTAYFSVTFSLNIILTLMIIVQLVWHSRNIRSALGNRTRANGLYETVVTILVESFAIYATSFILFVAPWGADSIISWIFQPVLGHTQVIAPFLIVLRVANRTALTSEVVSGNIGSIHFASQAKSTDSDGIETLPDGNPPESMDTNRGASGGADIEAGDTIDEVPR